MYIGRHKLDQENLKTLREILTEKKMKLLFIHTKQVDDRETVGVGVVTRCVGEESRPFVSGVYGSTPSINRRRRPRNRLSCPETRPSKSLRKPEQCTTFEG